jgi:hypothetical protein
MSYHFIMADTYGPFMREAELSMNRRNPVSDRLPVSRVARGGKEKLPMIHES